MEKLFLFIEVFEKISFIIEILVVLFLISDKNLEQIKLNFIFLCFSRRQTNSSCHKILLLQKQNRIIKKASDLWCKLSDLFYN